LNQLHDNQDNIVAIMYGGGESVAGTHIPGAIIMSGELGVSGAVTDQAAFALKEFKKEHITPIMQTSGSAEWK